MQRPTAVNGHLVIKDQHLAKGVLFVHLESVKDSYTYIYIWNATQLIYIYQ